MDRMKKYPSTWFCIGSGLGLTFGMIFDHLALGIVFGTGIGIVIDHMVKSNTNGKKDN